VQSAQKCQLTKLDVLYVAVYTISVSVGNQNMRSHRTMRKALWLGEQSSFPVANNRVDALE